MSTGRSKITRGRSLFFQCDQRTRSARRLRDLVDLLSRPLGGYASLDESTRQLCRRAATLSVEAELLDAKRATGEQIDPVKYATISNALARLLDKLEAKRPQPRPPTLEEVAEQIAAAAKSGRAA